MWFVLRIGEVHIRGKGLGELDAKGRRLCFCLALSSHCCVFRTLFPLQEVQEKKAKRTGEKVFGGQDDDDGGRHALQDNRNM